MSDFVLHPCAKSVSYSATSRGPGVHVVFVHQLINGKCENCQEAVDYQHKLTSTADSDESWQASEALLKPRVKLKHIHGETGWISACDQCMAEYPPVVAALQKLKR